jgi:hypothetical protein
MSILKKIQALFNENAALTEVGFVDVKSQDGALLLRVTGPFEIGSKVEVINADGSLSVPEDGDIILEDGNSISIIGGLIAEIATAEEEAKDEENAEAVVEAAPITSEVSKEKLEEVVLAEGDIKPDGEAPASEEIAGNLEERITALESRISEIIEILKTKEVEAQALTSENEVLKSKNEELNKLAAAPAPSFKKFEKPEIIKSAKASTMLEKVLNNKK